MKPLRTPADLLHAGLVAAEALPGLERVAARYAVAVTPAMAGLIDPADPHDPIARQFLPQPFELDATAEERADPIGDGAHSPLAGVVHRYADRVLLKLTHTCATYCRFCFRREVVGPGGGGELAGEALEAAMAYIAADPAIWEVILTGGDPLILSARRLGAVMARLEAIEHVKVVRLHTRIPAVDPAAVTPERMAALKGRRTAVYVVLHANHPRELTPAARAACARLVDAGVPMLSQSVLLRGVNDDPVTLEALMRAFVETRIKPYYLHHADLAPGTAHFRTTLQDGQTLMKRLRGRVSGLCQPTYVLDIPGGYGKAPVGPCYLHNLEDGVEVEAPGGARHAYPPET
ncbi:lysine-2,3-aminomutase-like protein [Caulobacter sp. S45]|uniref:lysine-2,3-aminomutase-like protein n=1 Tax=Caulobacter sp. S45 TaxID=1641861 RepID=UPI0020C7179D|nr:lysine-2,3-aminomutase-like protein [Caulobacter sp. S45]